MLGGPRTWYGRLGEEKILLSLVELELVFLGCPATRPVTILTELYLHLAIL
jgi:hypothetical protein